jgi:hypothetical protein
MGRVWGYIVPGDSMQTDVRRQQSQRSEEVADVRTADPLSAVEQFPVVGPADVVTSLSPARAHDEISPAQQTPAPEKPHEFDYVVEQLAHGMVAKDLDQTDQVFLASNGYRAMPIIRAKPSFVMRTFLPVDGSGKSPIVAFRGTVPSKLKTVYADLDPTGIGMYQFNPNQELIEAQMTAAAEHGKVVCSGHSLGGALAQIAAATFPGLVGGIVTFQAPGISRAMGAQLEAYNSEQSEEDKIMSSHHRVTGDVVPNGGEVLTPGIIHNHKMKGHNPLTTNMLTKHTSFPLAQEELALGNELPRHNAAKFVATGEVSTETDNAEKSQTTENARRVIGKLVYGIGGRGVHSTMGKLTSGCTGAQDVGETEARDAIESEEEGN